MAMNVVGLALSWAGAAVFMYRAMRVRSGALGVLFFLVGIGWLLIAAAFLSHIKTGQG